MRGRQTLFGGSRSSFASSMRASRVRLLEVVQPLEDPDVEWSVIFLRGRTGYTEN